METIHRLIWCAACATEVGLPLISGRFDGLAARWGLVGAVPTSCDHCHEKLASGQIAVGISSFESLWDYTPWESEFLTDLDEETTADRNGCAMRRWLWVASAEGASWSLRPGPSMLLAHFLAFLGGVGFGLALLKCCEVDLVLLSAGLSFTLAGCITAYRAI